MAHAPRGNQLRLTGSAWINKVLQNIHKTDENSPLIFQKEQFQ
jgi:hypothetical protein